MKAFVDLALGLIGKIDGTLIAAAGAIGWALYSHDHQTLAMVGAVVAAAVGALGLAGIAWALATGGHKHPGRMAWFGHTAPWLFRLAVLAGLGWAAAFAAEKADVKGGTTAAVAVSIAIFGIVGDIVKPLTEAVDKLRPVAFGKWAIQHSYNDKFNVDPASPVKTTNARNAVSSDPADVFGDTGTLVESVSGWKLQSRRRRLELIAAGL